MKHSNRSLPIATPGLARVVWDQQPRPSARSVARALTRAGRRVHFTTIARWKATGWRSSERDQHPLDAAREELDAAVPLLTGDPLTKVADIVAAYEAREELSKLSDQDLLHDAIRETSIALIVVTHEVQRCIADLVGNRPAEFGVLLRAMARFSEANRLASDELVALQAQQVG